jgi:hypothetical protein
MPANLMVAGMARSTSSRIIAFFNAHRNKLRKIRQNKIKGTSKKFRFRHSGGGRNPVFLIGWTPASAGVTVF